MAEDAKNSATDEVANEKGQAKDEQNLPKKKARKVASAKTTSSKSETSAKVDQIQEAEIVNTEEQKAAEEATEPQTSDESATKASKTKSTNKHDFQTEVREQIENCKFEIISSLQESVHRELKNVMHDQIRKTERRRIRGVIVRDIFILILAVVVGYFGYCLYDAKYFDFFQPSCEKETTCQPDTNTPDPEPEPEEVKDFAWYYKTYSYLFDGLRTNLNADTVSAYYLYSGDYKVADIPSNYLLGMAYNQLSAQNYTTNNILVSADDLRLAFNHTFGSTDYFNKSSFSHACHDFTYEKSTDTFVAPILNCTDDSTRKILEEVTDIYEEGNVLYFLTTATVYDRSDNSFYTFDNLFRPVATDVTEADLTTYAGLLNKYQYQFKRTDNNNYYFSAITKLK